jgi:hypothetical protein
MPGVIVDVLVVLEATTQGRHRFLRPTALVLKHSDGEPGSTGKGSAVAELGDRPPGETQALLCVPDREIEVQDVLLRAQASG